MCPADEANQGPQQPGSVTGSEAECPHPRCPDAAKCRVEADASGQVFSTCTTCDGAGRGRVAGNICRCSAANMVLCPADSKSAGRCVATDADCSQAVDSPAPFKRCQWSKCDSSSAICYVYRHSGRRQSAAGGGAGSEGGVATGVYSLCSGCSSTDEEEEFLSDMCPADEANQGTATATSSPFYRPPREMAVCYNPACPSKSKCRVISTINISTAESHGAVASSGVEMLHSTCSPGCDGDTEVGLQGNACKADVPDADRPDRAYPSTSPEGAAVATALPSSAAAGAAGDLSSVADVSYCVWDRKCVTGSGRCGVMDLGEDAGGVVTVCACAGNSDFERIRETMSGNVCAEQSARNVENDVAPVASPAVRVKAVLGGIGVEEFALKEDEFVESMAEAAGVEEGRVMVLSVMETSTRRHGRSLLAQGVQVVSEIETQTPQQMQGSFSEETLVCMTKEPCNPCKGAVFRLQRTYY